MSINYHSLISNKNELIDAIMKFGILPYFSNSIRGFSIEEQCRPDVLFSDSGDDTWSWKGEIIQTINCAYGKFFEKKACYVSRELFYDLANYRRDGYDFDARYDEGLAKFQDKQLYSLIKARAPVLSKELRLVGGYAYHNRWEKTGGIKGFDTSITRLQEQCYVLISDFVYSTDKYGNRRGWGVAEYNTPERFMGEAFKEKVYQHTPKESYEVLFSHLKKLFPNEDDKLLKRFLK